MGHKIIPHILSVHLPSPVPDGYLYKGHVALLSNNQVLHQLSVIIKREVFPLPSSFT